MPWNLSAKQLFWIGAASVGVWLVLTVFGDFGLYRMIQFMPDDPYGTQELLIAVTAVLGPLRQLSLTLGLVLVGASFVAKKIEQLAVRVETPRSPTSEPVRVLPEQR